MNVNEWLQKTVAGEIMLPRVITLSPTDSLAHAAGLLLREQVSGAPVVDGGGKCVGVLSAADVLAAEGKVEAERQKEAESNLWHSQLALPMSVYESRLAAIRDKIAPAAGQPVERFMTSDIVSVAPDAPALQVIQNMVDAHIHRVVVLDEERRLRGIITTIDVLAALLRTHA
jgi:CBS domain-containing protein